MTVNHPTLPVRLTGIAPPAPVPRAGALSLGANVSWTFLGNAIYATSQWGMLVLLARLGSPEMLGQFSFALAVTAPAILFSQLQLRGVQATDATRQFAFGDYLALRILLTVLALLAIGAICAYGGYPRQVSLVILAVAAAKGVESLSDICYGLLQQHERLDRVARSVGIKGPLQILSLGSGLLLARSLVVGIGLAAAALLAVLLLYDIPCSRRALASLPALRGAGHPVSLRRRIRAILRLVSMTGVMGIAAVLGCVSFNIPRYILARQAGEAALGVFSAVLYVIVAGNTVILALADSASNRLGRLVATEDPRQLLLFLAKLLAGAAVLGGVAILTAVTTGNTVLELVYGHVYAECGSLLVWVMVAGMLNWICIILMYAMTASRHLKSQAAIMVVATVASLVASSVFIPRYGLYGAAGALLAHFGVESVGRAAVLGWWLAKPRRASGYPRVLCEAQAGETQLPTTISEPCL